MTKFLFYLDFTHNFSYPAHPKPSGLFGAKSFDIVYKKFVIWDFHFQPDGIVMKYPCTGVILAGGLNTRFSGKEKALLEIAGTRILDRIFKTFRTLFNEIILVTNDPLKYLDWDAYIVTDLFSKRSALTGIHTGLYYSTYSHVFVSASDTPFLKKALIDTIVGEITPAVEVIIPETKDPPY